MIGQEHFGFSISGAAAEFFVAKEGWLHALPDDLSWTQGALVEPFSCGYYATVRADNLDASDTVRRPRRRPDRPRRGRRRRGPGRPGHRGRARSAAGPRWRGSSAPSSTLDPLGPGHRRAARRADRRRGAPTSSSRRAASRRRWPPPSTSPASGPAWSTSASTWAAPPPPRWDRSSPRSCRSAASSAPRASGRRRCGSSRAAASTSARSSPSSYDAGDGRARPSAAVLTDRVAGQGPHHRPRPDALTCARRPPRARRPAHRGAARPAPGPGRGRDRGGLQRPLRHRRHRVHQGPDDGPAAHAATRAAGTSAPRCSGTSSSARSSTRRRTSATSLGRRVACGAGVSCGECAWCRRGRTNLCARYFTLGLSTDGGLATYVAAPASTCVEIPEACTLRVGRARPAARGRPPRRPPLRGAAGRHASCCSAPARSGPSSCAGLEGHDGPVLAIDVDAGRLEAARALGATRTAWSSRTAGPDDVRDLVDGRSRRRLRDARACPARRSGRSPSLHAAARSLLVGLNSAPTTLSLAPVVLREVDVRTTVAHVCGERPARRARHPRATRTSATRWSTASSGWTTSSIRDCDPLAAGEVTGKILVDPRG